MKKTAVPQETVVEQTPEGGKKIIEKRASGVVVETTLAPKPVKPETATSRLAKKQAQTPVVQTPAKKTAKKSAPVPEPAEFADSTPWTAEKKAAFHAKMVAGRAAKKLAQETAEAEQAEAEIQAETKKTVKKIVSHVPAPKTEDKGAWVTVSAPESKPESRGVFTATESQVKTLEARIKALENQVASLTSGLNKVDGFMSALYQFSTLVGAPNNTPVQIPGLSELQSNVINGVKTGTVKGTGKKDPTLTKTGRAKKILTAEEKAVVRARFLKGREAAAARREAEEKAAKGLKKSKK
jgi:hypothetical protein